MLLVHALCTLAMLGIMWFVQIVHYPLFASVGAEQFIRYEMSHQTRTGWVVGPLMVGELVTGMWLVVDPPAGVPKIALAAGAVLIAALWLLTFLVHVPLHRRLAGGFNERTWCTLVRSNWPRTAIWTARGVLVLCMVYAARDAAG